MNSKDYTDMRYVATIRVSEQVNEAEWDVVNKTMQVKPWTTMDEIRAWAMKYYKAGFPNIVITILED